ncbi:unnamed protein product [Ascophyllum nodosum]
MVQKNTLTKRHLQINKKKHVRLSGRLHIEGRLNKGPLLQRNHKDVVHWSAFMPKALRSSRKHPYRWSMDGWQRLSRG